MNSEVQEREASLNLRHPDMNRPILIFSFSAIAVFTSAGMISAADPERTGPQSETGTLTVQEAVRMALLRAPEVLLAEAQAIRAREAVRETRSLNRPQVYTGTGLAYNNGYPLSMEGAAPSIFQVSGSQAIFSKKNANLIREAEESGKASGFGAESARNELSARTALAYYRLYKWRRQTQVASDRLAGTQKQQEQVESLLAAGRVRPVEASAAKTAVLAARKDLLVAQEQEQLAEKELRELTGIPETIAIRTAEPRIDSPILAMQASSLYREALEHTPEILQSQANVKAKEFHIEAEKGERLPKAEIVGQYALFSKTNNYADYFNRFSRNNYIVGISLQLPIFDGFRSSSRVSQSRQEAAEARYRLESLKSELKLSIERGFSALRIAQAEYDFAQSDAEASREMVNVNAALLEAGRISPKEMEESRSTLQLKEETQLEAGLVLFQRKIELLQTVGSLSSALH